MANVFRQQAWASWLTARTPALKYRDFRFLGAASLFASVGFVGELVIIGWVVLDRTGSTFMVGLALGVRMAPQFFLGIPAGALADRFDRRLLLRLLTLAAALASGMMGLLLWADAFALWQLYVLLTVSGGIQALLMTARQSYVYDIVGRVQAVSGLTLVALATRMGAFIGSLMAGAVTARWGAGQGFMALAAAYAAALVLLLLVRSRGQAAPPPGGSVWRNLREYFAEVRRNRALLALVILTAGVEVLGFSNMAVMPSIARDVLNIGAGGLGVLNAFRSVGGMAGVVVLTAIGDTKRKGLLFLAILPFFGLAIVALGYVDALVLALVVVTAISVLAMMSDVLSQALMQLSVSNELRGRAMGSWVLAVGTAPIGHLQIGALAAATTVTIALTANGLGLVVLAIVAGLSVARLRRL